jgi:hypothetical protein
MPERSKGWDFSQPLLIDRIFDSAAIPAGWD